MGLVRVVKHVAARLVDQREVKVSALPGVAHGPLRHERSDQLTLVEVGFGKRLEHRSVVCGPSIALSGERALPDAGAGLTVQAFERAVERLGAAHQASEQVCMLRRPQHGVTEVARAQRPQIPIALLPHGVRRLIEHEEFVLKAAAQSQTNVGELLQENVETAARTQRVGTTVRDELAEKERTALTLEPTLGGDHQSVSGVRKAGVPAGQRLLAAKALVQHVVDVPTEHAVAEAPALAEHAFELVERDVLAPHDPVDVRQPELDVLGTARSVRCHLLGQLVRHTCRSVAVDKYEDNLFHSPELRTRGGRRIAQPNRSDEEKVHIFQCPTVEVLSARAGSNAIKPGCHTNFTLVNNQVSSHLPARLGVPG